MMRVLNEVRVACHNRRIDLPRIQHQLKPHVDRIYATAVSGGSGRIVVVGVGVGGDYEESWW